VGDVAERLWGVIEPYVAAEGIELDDIEVAGKGGGTIVRITLDGDPPLTVDRVAELSRGLSRLLDEADPIVSSYTLEVGSPGLERSLRRPRHFEKSVGREAKVKTVREIDQARNHRGMVVTADDDGFVLDVDGSERRIAYRDVASARTVFVWEKGAKPGKRKK
jgi:ribosome maturation factor RimP